MSITVILFSVGCITHFNIFCLTNQAVSHGAYSDEEYDFQTEPMSQIKARINMTPKDQSDELPEDKTGIIIIFYRWGCKDCEAIYDDLNKQITSDNIYFVSTRSEIGKQLVQDYNILRVPSGIYIGKTTPIIKYLAEEQEDNETIQFLSDNYLRLEELQQKENKEKESLP